MSRSDLSSNDLQSLQNASIPDSVTVLYVFMMRCCLVHLCFVNSLTFLVMVEQKPVFQPIHLACGIHAAAFAD